MTTSEFWTPEDYAHLEKLEQEGKDDEVREFVAKKMFEARPVEFGPYFTPEIDDPMPYAEMQKLPIDEAVKMVTEWAERTTIREWDKLSEDQKEDVYWQLSFIAQRVLDKQNAKGG